MFLYIHGFAGSKESKKAQVLKEYFQSEVIEPISFSFKPKEAIKELSDYIESLDYKKLMLVGSSLGGYYAMYLANKYNIYGTLLNPATKPYILLEQFVGENKNLHSGEKFDFKKEYLDDLKALEVKNIDSSKFLLLTQRGDELIDADIAINELKNSEKIIIEGGSHSFLDFEKYLPSVKKFYLKHYK